MNRHAALIQFSHDHHHGLVEARRLRRAAAAGPGERRQAAAAFLASFERETKPHLRDEEERLFPLLVGGGERATELLGRALLEHQEIYALARDLTGDAEDMQRLAGLLDAHIRFEERTLFPLIEEVASEAALGRMEETSAPRKRGGPVWGTETADLNATLLDGPPGEGPPEHVNDERDVLVVVLSGSAVVSIDGDERVLQAGEMLVIEKGRSRRIAGGPKGVRYVAAHRRRSPLQVARVPPAG